MTPHLVKWYALLGLVLLLAGFFAARFLLRRFRAGYFSRSWLVAELCPFATGVAWGGFLARFTIFAYPIVKTVGFPFLTAVFELRDGHLTESCGPVPDIRPSPSRA